jgi:hypothetical protein
MSPESGTRFRKKDTPKNKNLTRNANLKDRAAL